MELERARAIAEQIKALLEPGCHRIVIAGSIRRNKPFVGDIEFLVIPRGDMLDRILHDLMMENVLAMRLNSRGSRAYGPKNKLMVHCPSGIGVDIFSTDENCWWTALVLRTGGKDTNMRIATTALKKGWRFRAYGDGFDTPLGHIHCNTEAEVFTKVGLEYLPPEKRS